MSAPGDKPKPVGISPLDLPPELLTKWLEANKYLPPAGMRAGTWTSFCNDLQKRIAKANRTPEEVAFDEAMEKVGAALFWAAIVIGGLIWWLVAR